VAFFVFVLLMILSREIGSIKKQMIKNRTTRKKTEEKKKSLWLKRMAQINVFLILSVFFIYLSVGIFFDSSFFKRDLLEKIGIVAGSSTTALSVRVVGPPEKPVVTATPMCDGAASPFVKITWNTTLDTDYYDISRDGGPLVAGLAGTSHDDYAVSYSTLYSYLVTAFGPFGSTASDPALVTTTNDCGSLPVPSCVITKFDKINLAGYFNIPKTENQHPKIYGTTNMPNATIYVTLTGEASVLGATQASSTGYWTWKPAHGLPPGSYHLLVSAVDIANPARTADASMDFKINEKEDEKEKKKEKITPSEEIISIKPTPPKQENEAFRLSIQVNNPNDTVYTSKDLRLRVSVSQTDKFPRQEQELHYYITDPNGKTVFEDTDNIFIDGDIDFDKTIMISKLMKPGIYKIFIESSYGDILVTADHSFLLKEIPIISMGGVSLTLTEIMSKLSWIIASLLLLFIILILMMITEYLIYDRSLIHITEKNLRDKGFIGKRKGVSR
jgi:hypothetical protein